MLIDDKKAVVLIDFEISEVVLGLVKNAFIG